MSTHKVIAAAFLISGAILLAQQPPASDRDARWRQDLELLQQEFSARSKPLQDDAAKKQAFLQRMAQLQSSIAGSSDEQLIVGIMRALATTGDSHTSVNFAKFGAHQYPLEFYWFDEGIYVTRTSAAQEQLLGARLEKIGGAPIEQVLPRFSELIPHENDSVLKAFVPPLLVFGELLKGLDLATQVDNARFGFRLRDGSAVEVTPHPLARGEKIVAVPAPQLRYSHLDENYWFKRLPDQHAIYFQYQHCWELQGQPFAAFQQQLLSAIDTAQPERLIIDLRDNGGGNSAILDRLIAELARRSADPKNPLSIIVFIGRGTFSSAALNAADLKLKAHATFVGEPSGAKPNHYGELKAIDLPNSHLRVFYSTQYWRPWPSDSDPSLMPDVAVPETWSDFSSGRDAALDAALKGSHQAAAGR
jgi:hypothetical protein